MAIIPDYVHAATGRVLRAVLPLYLRTPGGIADAEAYARYRRVLARLLADVREAARSRTLAEDLALVSGGYRTASDDPRAVITGLERVIVAARGHVPPTAGRGLGSRLQAANEMALTLLVECLSVASQGHAVAALVPRSFEEATRYRQSFGRSIDLAIERASDAGWIDTARALRDLQGRIARDMIERGRPLARIVGYQTAVPLPAVTLAHLLYRDGTRAGELMNENAAFDHPAFMPTTGRAYSR